MSVEFRLPSLGENVEEGDVLSLLVSEGDQIEAEQGVLEIETEKATMEVPCPHAGRVSKVHVSEGDTVKVGTVLLTIEDADGKAEKQKAKAEEQPQDQDEAPEEQAAEADDQEADDQEEAAEQDEDAEEAETVEQAEAEEDGEGQEEEDGEEPGPEKVATPKARQTAAPAKKKPEPHAKEKQKYEPRSPIAKSAPPSAAKSKKREGPSIDVPGDGRSTTPAGPAVRRLARELGVDLARVPASDPGGRISRDDVLAHVRHGNERAAERDRTSAVVPPGEPASDDWGPVRCERLSRIRQTIGERMFHSYSTIPQLTNFDDADITELEQIRQASKADYAQRGIKLTTLPFIIKALASALRLHPIVNSTYDAENQQVIYKEYVSIGVAVDTPRGLVVPVMRDVDRMNIPQVAENLAKLAELAREGKYSLEDLRGGTFTVSNLGSIGGTYSTPIINPPEVAILLPGRARKLPVFVQDKIEGRLMLPLSLTYDHRLVDGAAAGRFLNEVKGYLQAPGRLLLAP